MRSQVRFKKERGITTPFFLLHIYHSIWHNSLNFVSFVLVLGLRIISNFLVYFKLLGVYSIIDHIVNIYHNNKKGIPYNICILQFAPLKLLKLSKARLVGIV